MGWSKCTYIYIPVDGAGLLAETDIILEPGQCVETDNAGEDTEILEEEDCQRGAHARLACRVQALVHLGHHVDQRNVEEHSSSQTKYVYVHIQLT